MTKKKAGAATPGPAGINTKVNFIMIRDMGKARWFGQMAVHTRVTGKMGFSME